MAETGGTLLPTTPAFPISAQLGGVKFDASGNHELEKDEKLIDDNVLFDGLITVRDASGVYKQYSKAEKKLIKEHTKTDFKKVLDEKIKEKKLIEGPIRGIYAKAGFETEVEEVIRRIREEKEKEKELKRTQTTTPTVETKTTSVAETQPNVESKPATSNVSTATNSQNNTTEISASVKEELRKILKDDAKLNEAIKLLNETEPSKLRSNIIFNPDYKPVAELIKEIVAFKIKQYADKMAELEKAVDVVPGETLGSNVATTSEIKPEEQLNPTSQPSIVSTLEANVASTSGKETSETLDQNVDTTSGENTKSKTEEIVSQTLDQNVDTTSEPNPEQLPIESTSDADADNTSSVASNETIENGLSNVSSITNNGNVSNIASETSENTSVENIPETNITKVNTTLLNNSEAEAKVKTGGKTKKKKSNLRKLKTMKKRKNK